MREELYYDRKIKKWRIIDPETGQLKGSVRSRSPFLIVSTDPFRRLGEIIGMNTLGFFSILMGNVTYKNRVFVSYAQLQEKYGMSSATIKKHLDCLKSNNIVMEEKTRSKRKYYLVNGDYIFRGNKVQREENKKLFEENLISMSKEKNNLEE